MLPAPPAVADTTQATSTQIVNISLDGGFCPQHGLYGIAHVTVDGTAGMRADQNFIWTTQTAATSIHSVPPGGAVGNFTVVYHCNVQVLWWLEPGSARRVTAALWVNGSSPQPSYTIKPGRQASQTTPPLTPSPAPSQAPQPTPPQELQPTTLPTTPLMPSPSQTLQPTTPLTPPPVQALQPTPSPSLPLTLTPTPPQALQPAPPPSLPLTLTPTPPQALQPPPSPLIPLTPTPQPVEPTPSPSLPLTPTPPQTLEPTLPPTPTSSPTSQETSALTQSPTPTP